MFIKKTEPRIAEFRAARDLAQNAVNYFLSQFFGRDISAAGTILALALHYYAHANRLFPDKGYVH